MPRVLAACGGFLLAVLWMDLMFDVQAAALSGNGPAADEAIVASIAGYYRRVTTDATPMNRLIGGVMLVTVAGSLWQAVRSRRQRTVSVLAFLLAAGPIALAVLRVFPDAARLGARADPFAFQASLATTILRDHVVCFVAMSAFVGIQLTASRSAASWRGD